MLFGVGEHRTRVGGGVLAALCCTLIPRRLLEIVTRVLLQLLMMLLKGGGVFHRARAEKRCLVEDRLGCVDAVVDVIICDIEAMGYFFSVLYDPTSNQG